ncbi:zinc finger, CCHC-type containing protein [Tanacetum coccineum]
MFRLNIVNDNIASAFMSTSKLNDSILWHARLGHVHFKRMQDMSKDGLIPTFDMDTEKCKTCMLTKITKKPFQNVKRETKVLELIHSDLCDLHATPSLGNKKYFVTFIDDASRAVVRLPDPKLKTLGERGIECIFVGYAEHSKAFRKLKVDGTIKKLKARLVIQGFKQKLGIDYFDTYAPVAHINTIILLMLWHLSQSDIHQNGCDDAILNGEWRGGLTCIDVGKQRQCWKVTLMQAGSATLKIIHLKVDGYSCLLGGGAISWASKKQTCITGFTIEYEFVAVAKEAEWLKNLLFEIPL